MAQVIQMTTEQLQQLIESVRTSNPTASAGLTVSTQSKGSFSNCTASFDGQRDHEAVEEFITSIVTYKEVESISDEDALKGVPLLFYGLASTWWQGIRKEAKTWNDVLSLIREHFSPTKPAYQVYMEIFEKKQDDKAAIDTFVCQKRALLAQLPDDRHDEETELDFIYGLVNIKYRKHIARHDIKNFKDLLEKGRIIEHNNLESEANGGGYVKGAKRTTIRCTYCNFRGHNQYQCRKRKREENTTEDYAVPKKRHYTGTTKTTSV
ncbi:activity-regulated cytoskeleton associated protein 2-like [Glossina fuscipes]|uniref:Activity-regulated cytoskeleton associated protein 2-like n=1 Tax=Glossina fuscipes TaxID=7396 RepID=A0A9C5YV08_9MUSC|nr:activity-regulated cytoskeleton associated protein 2-like [Glossina fuscipes]